MAESDVSELPLFGKGSRGSLLCATRVERDQLQEGPSIPFPALGILSMAVPQQIPLYPTAWQELYCRTGPGRALTVESDLQPSQQTQERPQPRGTRCRIRGSRDSCGAQAPGSAPHALLELGVHLAVPSSFRLFPAIFFFPLPSSHIIETPLLALIAGNDYHFYLGDSFDPCYR